MLIFLLTSVFFLLLWWWMIRRPIRGLIRVIEEAPSKDFLNRASVGRHLIGQLAQSFNGLLEQITSLNAFKIQTERQLIRAEEELKYKEVLEGKNRIIEKTNEDLEARLKELSLLYDFSREITATLESEDLYNILEDFLGERLGFREFVFLVYEEEEAQLVVRVARGFPEPSRIRGMTFRAGEGITGRVLQQGSLVYLADTGLNRDYLYYKGERREDGSFLSLPLLFRRKVVGVLNMFRPGRHRFSEAEIRFLNTLAVELAIAVVNSRLYSKTRELSVRDELTELYNRRHFQEVLPLEIKRAQRFQKPLTLLMLDIDYFKKYNDRHGHLAGDELLKEFVRIVNSRTREVDFFARFGGEEFALILHNTSREDGFRVAEKLRALVGQHDFPVGPENPPERMTVSIGLSAYPDDAESMEDLLDAADIALYEAKGAGRDRVAVYEKPVSTAQGRHHLL